MGWLNDYLHKLVSIGNGSNKVSSWSQSLTGVPEHGPGPSGRLERVVEGKLTTAQVKEHVLLLVTLC